MNWLLILKSLAGGSYNLLCVQGFAYADERTLNSLNCYVMDSFWVVL